MKPLLNSARVILLFGACGLLLKAQQIGFIAGVVRTHSGTPVEGAEVALQSELTGSRQKVYCDKQGRYESRELAAGTYKLTVRSQGFRTITQAGVVVQASKTRAADFAIDLYPLQQEVTVETSRDEGDPAGNGLAVSRGSSTNTLPANGRDLHALYPLLPGATVTPASTGDGGQFTVMGQRPNTNTFRIDGISGNTGLGISAVPGAFTGSSLPAMTVIGSTQNMASKEDIERVELRSSDFAPEFGDRPGAQIAIETRSGSNDFHGSAFGYLRPQSLDSRDWFAEKYDAPLAAASLNGFGGSLGGPLWRNRTFFFAAYERVDVSDTAAQLMAVPSLLAREAAPPLYRLLVNAFPLPSGPSLGPDEARATIGLRKQASVQNFSGRIDQAVGERERIFARYANVPSRSTTEQLDTSNSGFRWASATLGSTTQWGETIHDFRFNFSRVVNTSAWSAGNAREQAAFDAYSLPQQIPPDALSSFFPFTVKALSIAGVGQLLSGAGDRSYQNQLEGTYTFARRWGAHDFRAGADYIRLLPRTPYGGGASTVSFVSAGIPILLGGHPLGVTVSDGRGSQVSGQIHIGSVFLQDSFKVTERLSLLYGLRWEITPRGGAPSNITYYPGYGSWYGPGTFFLISAAGQDGYSWFTTLAQLAPRFGLAYRLKALNLVLRAGGGVFYDTAFASLLNPVNLSAFNSWEFVPSTASFTPVRSGPFPQLALPKVWEWRTSVEKSIHEGSALSMAYVGSAGRTLLREQAGTYPPSGLLEGIEFASNGRSDYEALEAQYSGHITPRLYALMSYTWGHSIDNGSDNSSIFLVPAAGTNSIDRGSSNFDVRHNASFSLSYALPGRGLWFRGWNLSSTIQARSGFPFDVTTVDRSVGLGFADSGRPDVVPGVPTWMADSAVPGGRALNRAAFAPAPSGTTGTLGRNVLTGSSLFQADASLRRQFRLRGATSLEVSMSAFNVMNRASFSNPVGYMRSALFGQPTSMQNLMLGSGSPTGGITPIFQAGGPRTAELHFKFSF